MNYLDFMMSIGQNEEILKLMPLEEQFFAKNFVNERKRELAKIENRRKMEELRHKMKHEKSYTNLLGLDHGEWVRNIPKYKRFVIAVKDGKRFTGCNCTSELKDPNKWENIKECFAIDLLRGFKSPYWGYYAVINDMVELQAKAFYKKRVSKVMYAKTDDELCKVLDSDWNFFKCDDHNEINLKFGILDYIIDAKGEFKILGVSEYKTLAEHQEDLRRKYKK